MPDTEPSPCCPCPALFDVTTVADDAARRADRAGRARRARARRRTRAARSPDEGIERLAGMLMRTGQLVPCIGHRPDPDAAQVLLYDGQRRYLAAPGEPRARRQRGHTRACGRSRA